ncbi:MAG: hypothetical protein DIJKHBIC_03987 [Thermoanaerobaculia bacterium]|nr:hypothetical protein [Thermoanaerobaculia bacterium]
MYRHRGYQPVENGSCLPANSNRTRHRCPIQPRARLRAWTWDSTGPSLGCREGCGGAAAHLRVEFDDVAIGENVVPVDLLTIELRVPPDPGEAEALRYLLVHPLRQVVDGGALWQNEGR